MIQIHHTVGLNTCRYHEALACLSERGGVQWVLISGAQFMHF